MTDLFISILPLLFLVVLGYVSGRAYKLSTSQFGYVVAFVLAPIVSFGAILQLEIKLDYIFLPVFLAIICTSMALIAFYSGKLYLSGTIPNLAGMASSAGNTGFFGLPVYLFFAPTKMVGIYLLANVGIQIIENSVGYYIASRGHYGIKDSLMKLVKMPQIWSVILAILLNLLGLELPEIAVTYWKKMMDTWIVLGMFMIGIALASCASFKPDLLFCTHMMLMRFIMWPLVTACVLYLDYTMLHVLRHEVYFILAVIAFVPLPGNSVALSSTLGLHPDKMAFAVMLSTIIALFLVPFFISHIYLLLNQL